MGQPFFECSVILRMSLLVAISGLPTVTRSHVGGRRCTRNREEKGKKWERKNVKLRRKINYSEPLRREIY